MPNSIVRIREPQASVVANDPSISVNVTERVAVVNIGITGPQGPKGEDGVSEVVVLTEVSYVHHQSSASDVWTITHNLSFYPNITIVDSADTVVEGSYEYPNATTVIARFSGAFSGKAYLS